ncbi:MAG: TetR/AcrR family transcriptional regulator [Deltaproteobacteria bacterium]|nr:TetR/AcrR family transcriptional regulator [Deltaproteobacteria bacterium]
MTQPTDKRSAILQATLELISENGFHGTPTSMIAERAGVGVGTIYRYFKDKEELIHALYEEMEGKQKIYVLEGYSEEMPFRERFVHLCRNVYRYLMANRLEFCFLEQYFDSPYGVTKMKQKLESASEPFHSLVESGKKQQVIKDIPLILLYSLIFGPIINSIKDHNSGLLELNETLIEQVIGAMWDAIKR